MVVSRFLGKLTLYRAHPLTLFRAHPLNVWLPTQGIKVLLYVCMYVCVCMYVSDLIIGHMQFQLYCFGLWIEHSLLQ